MKILKPKEASEKLNVTVWTLQDWDRKGKLKVHTRSIKRTVLNHKKGEKRAKK